MIGEKIKALRLARGLTQQQFADKLAINRSTISNYELGNREPRLAQLNAIANAFGVSTDFFGVVAKDEVRAKAAWYVKGLLDAGLITERERGTLFVYTTV